MDPDVPPAVGQVMFQLFHFKNTLIVCNNGTQRLQWKELFKQTRKGIPTHLPDPMAVLNNLQSSLVICAQEYNRTMFQNLFQRNNYFESSVHFPMLFFVTSSLIEYIQSDAESLKLNLNKEIYFLNDANQNLEEIYTHNGHTVRTRILHMVPKDRGYLLTQQFDPFVKRRQNFQGVELRVLFEDQNPYIMFHNYTIPPALPGQTMYCFDRFNASYGMFKEILNALGTELNFTYKACRRFDEQWGTWINGTTTGMINSLQKNEADLIGTSVTLNPERYHVVDYLHPLGTETYAIYIGNPKSESADWRLYSVPFSFELWGFLLSAAFALALTIHIMEFLYVSHDQVDLPQPGSFEGLKEVFQIVPSAWMVFGSYFGRKPQETNSIKKYAGVKIMVFSILLTGNVVFMSYRASITSELSVWELRLPFRNLWELLQSNFKLMTTEGGIIQASFINAEESNILFDVYEYNMKPLGPEAFVRNTKEGLKAILDDKEMAYFYSMESINALNEYHCKTIPAWITDYPGLLSYALPKKSPYTKFMYYKILNLLERGKLAIFKKRWKSNLPECTPNRVVSLGFQKIFTSFLLVVLGAILAFLTFLVELMWAPKHHRKEEDPWTRSQRDALRQLQLVILNKDELLHDRDYLLYELEEVLIKLKTTKFRELIYEK
ncbi:hypothetical protein TCAL_08764, partial [Tigriopus californicus]|eukprot:TCALIF_08764-PA protein Name:"Similar to Grik4 Glutamate receptor ionotropic, kainate 4 (Mus musculus)" AED:0.19 eAED:0.25 QI:34/0/0/1/1/0/2/0/662